MYYYCQRTYEDSGQHYPLPQVVVYNYEQQWYEERRCNISVEVL